MTIYDLINLFIDNWNQEVCIYDMSNDGKVLYKGNGENIPLELEDMEILSIDNLEKDCILCINVETEN